MRKLVIQTIAPELNISAINYIHTRFDGLCGAWSPMLIDGDDTGYNLSAPSTAPRKQ